jgi:hypothetical protein
MSRLVVEAVPKYPVPETERAVVEAYGRMLEVVVVAMSEPTVSVEEVEMRLPEPSEVMMVLGEKPVEPVPPLAVGRVPETWVVRAILPHDGAAPIPPEMRALPVAVSARRESEPVVPAYRMSPTTYDELPVPP